MPLNEIKIYVEAFSVFRGFYFVNNHNTVLRRVAC